VEGGSGRGSGALWDGVDGVNGVKLGKYVEWKGWRCMWNAEPANFASDFVLVSRNAATE